MRASLALLSIILLAGPVLADDDPARARAALERGEARPLAEVLAASQAAVPGDVVSVKLKSEGKGERWLYELKILTPTGLRREVEIDARTLAVLEIETED